MARTRTWIVGLATGLAAAVFVTAGPALAIPVDPGGGGGDPPPDDCVAASTGTLTVSPSTVLPGQPVTVSWSVDQILGCTVWKAIDGPGFGGSVAASGSRTVTLSTQGTASWSLSVSGSAGNHYTLDTATATVQPPPPPLAAYSPLAAAKDGTGRVQTIMVRGDDTILRDHEDVPFGDFLGWTVAPGLLRSVAAERDGSGRVVEAGFNANGNVWASIQDAPGGTGWSGWTLLDGLITSIALARNQNGLLELFATNGAGTIFHRTQTAAGTVSFGGWQVFPGLLQQIAAETNADGRIEVVGVNSAGQIWHQSQTAINSQTWSGWASIPGTLTSIAVAPNIDGGDIHGVLEIFGTTPDGSLVAATQSTRAGPSFNAFFAIPDGHGGPVAAEPNAYGRIVVYGRDSAGVMSFRYQNGAGQPNFVNWLPLTQYLAAPAPIGSPRHLTVVPVNWAAGNGTQAAPQIQTLDQITAMVNANLWNEMSYGHWPGWTVDGHAPITIDPPHSANGACQDQFTADLLHSVQAAGISASGSDTVLVYFSNISLCTLGGLATGNYTWINGGTMYTVTHELGHRLGLDHARSKVCQDGAGNTVPLSGSCTVVDYGDANDIMGRGAAGFNAIERQKLGWLSGRLTDVPSGGGTYTLTPLELTTPGQQALRINDGTTLWVEYRQRIGQDIHGLDSPGVLVYQQDDSVLRSYQLNMRPGDPNGFRNLPVGASWVNPLGSLKITVNWANSTGASVTIAPAIPPVAVPYLIDDTCAQALAELESVGLAGNCWGTGDYVGNQSPGGGSLVPPGTVVSLQMAVNPP